MNTYSDQATPLQDPCMNRVLGYTPKLAIRDISHIFIDLTFLNSRRMIKYSVSGETQMPGLFVDDGEAFAFPGSENTAYP